MCVCMCLTVQKGSAQIPGWVFMVCVEGVGVCVLKEKAEKQRWDPGLLRPP